MMTQTELNKLIKQLIELRNSPLKDVVEKRLKEFENSGKKNGNHWFYELCFCFMTSNWKAKESIKIQKEIGITGFINYSEKKLQSILKKNGHRFHPQRAKYIVRGREFIDIKRRLKGLSETEARAFIAKNIYGIGYKEASHFLRNVGYKDLAILDRHIIALMKNANILPEFKTLTPIKYIESEKELIKIGKKINMNMAELDLYMWYLKTNEILK